MTCVHVYHAFSIPRSFTKDTQVPVFPDRKLSRGATIFIARKSMEDITSVEIRPLSPEHMASLSGNRITPELARGFKGNIRNMLSSLEVTMDHKDLFRSTKEMISDLFSRDEDPWEHVGTYQFIYELFSIFFIFQCKIPKEPVSRSTGIHPIWCTKTTSTWSGRRCRI